MRLAWKGQANRAAPGARFLRGAHRAGAMDLREPAAGPGAPLTRRGHPAGLARGGDQREHERGLLFTDSAIHGQAIVWWVQPREAWP